MDSEKMVKIAAALGMAIGTIESGELSGFFYGSNGTVACAEKDLEQWLNTADGEKAVREQVIKAVGDRDVMCIREGLSKRHRVIILWDADQLMNYGYDYKWSPDEFSGDSHNTELEALVSAILWLAERAAKEGA